jgi:hypothetical protein
VTPGTQKSELQRNPELVPPLASLADDFDVRGLEGIVPGQLVPICRDGEKVIALTFGQELMFALHHADSCPQKAVLWTL